MSNFFKIPVGNSPQSFSVTLGGTVYQMTLKYLNCTEGGWVLDIADSSGSPLVLGIPLVTGADLLGQYKHLGFAGRLWVQTSGDADAVPTFGNLGTDANIYWVTD